MRLAHAGIAGLLALAPLGSSALAQSGTLYFNSFESGPLGSEWSSLSRLEAWTPQFTRFNGRYSNGSTTLTLAQPTINLPNGRSGSSSGGDGGGGGGGGSGGDEWFVQYTLTFDFYAIDSWDGSATVLGPDWFKVTANGATLFRETFTNHAGHVQSAPSPTVGPTQLGFDDRWNDSIYRSITRTFRVEPGVPIVITWADEGLQGMNDESWGIDNVRVSYAVVPSPGTVLPLAAGALTLLRRRRR